MKREEKIFLLVSRSLNDKKSVLSHVYKQLMSDLKERAAKRKASKPIEAGDRSTRQDIHAVIKHLTTILLEDRTEFCTSPAITKLSASCVESIILSEIYEIVYDEILDQTQRDDQLLLNTISNYESNRNSSSITDSDINERAVCALQSMPNHRSVSGKLDCCVHILEAISDNAATEKMGTDWLLESVCKHIMYAKVPNLNAELSFLEEFATDRQLLRGIEGYSLITMLASLNFLSAKAADITHIS